MIGRIQKLDPHLADLIAAGEVVERPASVVKELMENSIDAGATKVTVEIQNGGMSLIRVTDNGSGILPEDVKTAFLRHATSKIQKAEDLEAIGTLGFRGEALAAIAAVSRLELLSRTADAPFGVAFAQAGGTILSEEETGCPVGTTVVVRDLFYNTPARQKFMKRDSAEGAAVFALVQRIALSHPEVSIKFLRDGKQELLTPGDSKLSTTMYTVFGRDIALGFTEVRGSVEQVEVEGFVSMPACCRGTRSYQHFILNGRAIKSRLLTAALEEAYQNQKMVGKFPGCVLHIKTKASAVDVNVHPAKTEVKFFSDKIIFDGVYYTVLSALEGERRHPVLPIKDSQALEPETTKEDPVRFQDSMAGVSPRRFPSSPTREVYRTVEGPSREDKNEPEKDEAPAPENKRSETEERKEDVRDSTSLSVPEKKEEVEEEVPFLPEEAMTEGPWRLAGELLNTYLLVERGDVIYLIDKHAAHERMQFDRMKAGELAIMAQSLMEPLVFSPPPEEAAALLAQLPLLEKFGFTVEDFGGGAVVVRQIPFDITPEEAVGVLGELAEGFLRGVRQDPASARDHLLHTMACKAAIRGGEKQTEQELWKVAEAVMAGDVKYCPHGRPVAITLTRAQLERRFGRA